MVISVSRRCDIPRFRFDWFLERLEAGYADVANPYNTAQIKRVSLKPDDVDCLVFWTRDPRPILAGQNRLLAYPFYIMTTLTGYPKILEPDVPPPDEIIHALKTAAGKWGPKRVIWRYDPVFLSNVTDSDFHRRNFRDLSNRLAGSVNRVIVSVYDEYPGAKRRLSALENNGLLKTFPHYGEDGRFNLEITELLAEFADAAGKAGMEIQSCAEGEELSTLGIKHGACIDGELCLFQNSVSFVTGSGKSGLKPVFSYKSKVAVPKTEVLEQPRLIKEIAGPGKFTAAAETRDKNQRQFCRCYPSVDIGSYGACPAGCAYCYARR
ncbi:MAG: DUF1848 domain-containing protein [Treponema sp.]|nr:DUF1848 domain-containing protein [Treponema sp.]